MVGALVQRPTDSALSLDRIAVDDFNRPTFRAQTDTDATVDGVPAAVSDAETRPLSGIQLVCVAGDDLGHTFAITSTPVVIGRSGVDVVLRAADVSRSHARITRRAGQFWIEDMTSANGTFLNGTAIARPVELRFGDRVQLGSTILLFGRHDELEERMRQLQKLEAMSALVKGLAHDFNNTLQVLLASVDELNRLAPTEPMQEVIHDMVNATSSASGLVRRLMRFGRNKPPTMDLVDVATTIRGSVAMATRLLPPRIQLVVEEPVEALVRGSRSELEQAVLNLVANARDAMPAAGTIEVRSRLLTFDRAAARARHMTHEGTFVEIVVSDNGTGMDEQTVARAFEPFFTTKNGFGTGLGLAMVYSTIKSHGGMTSIESIRDVGTKVTLLLPAIA